MADEDAKESSTTKPTLKAQSSRPQSARAKKKADLKNLDLIMSGLKTDKEKLLARMLQAQIKKTNEREGEMRKLTVEMRQSSAKVADLEKTAKQARNAVYKEQKLRTTAITEQQQIKATMAKIQKAVSARLKLLGIDFSKITSIGEALDASLRAINQLMAELAQKEALIAKLEETIDSLNRTVSEQNAKIEALELKVSKQKQLISEMKAKLEDNAQRIATLETENAELRDSNKSQADRIKELEVMLKGKRKEMKEYRASTDDTIRGKDGEIRSLNDKVAELQKEIERLLAIINVPKASVSTQTVISGDHIVEKINDHSRLLKEIEALRSLLEKKSQQIALLEEENALLNQDLQYLLRRVVAFYTDRSSHTGQVWNMLASPTRYIVATAATDCTVRLWKIQPEADKAKGQKVAAVIKCARMDGKVDSLAWSPDGSMLAAGTGYRDGAEGFLCVWNMVSGKTQFEVQHAIRSRPTVRFGRVNALCFSRDGRFVFCGDTVGNIWCIALESESVVGLFQHHQDVVLNMVQHPTLSLLFSCSLDATIAVVVLPEECGGVKGEREAFLAQQLENGGGDEEKERELKRKKSPRRKGKGGKKDKHWRNRSKTTGNTLKSPRAGGYHHEQASSKTLQGLLDEANFDVDDFGTYQGITLYKDEKYAVWRLRVSTSGKTLVAATRKIMVFNIAGTASIVKGPNVSDTDNEHVKSLNVKNGYILTARAGCVRSKMWSMDSGKQHKVFKAKKAIAQSDFLCDDKWCVVLQQELIANAAPKAPSMKLYQYKNKTPELKASAEPQLMGNDLSATTFDMDVTEEID